MARGDQLGRQWKIIQHLMAARRGRTVAEIAAAVGSHPRSVYRDLEALETGGFPLYTEREGNRNRWCLLEEARRPVPIPLDPAELMALSLGRNLLGGLEGTVFAAASASLADKIRAVLAPAYRDYLDRLASTLTAAVPPHKDYATHAAVLDRVNRALMERRWLDITYFAMHRNEETRREVAPCRLRYADGALYLVAFCRLREGVRIFAVDRIREARVLDEAVLLPDDFDADAYLEASFGVFQGPVTEVRIRFSPRVAGYIAERTWHRSQRLEETADGGLIFTAEVAGLTEIKAWVLRWGAEAQVLHPEPLRAAVRAEAEAMARQYRTRRSTPGRRPPSRG